MLILSGIACCISFIGTRPRQKEKRPGSDLCFRVVSRNVRLVPVRRAEVDPDGALRQT